eukprot:5328298-Pyramimonas_sp.AAC.1
MSAAPVGLEPANGQTQKVEVFGDCSSCKRAPDQERTGQRFSSKDGRREERAQHGALSPPSPVAPPRAL